MVRVHKEALAMFIKIIKNHALTAIFCGLFFYLIYESIGFSIQARLFPLIIGIVGAVLTGIQLVRELRSTLFASSEPEIIKDDPGPGGDSDFAITGAIRMGCRAFAQYLAFWILRWGSPVGGALYVARKRKIEGSDSSCGRCCFGCLGCFSQADISAFSRGHSF
jgi:hypothetical protein